MDIKDIVQKAKHLGIPVLKTNDGGFYIKDKDGIHRKATEEELVLLAIGKQS